MRPQQVTLSAAGFSPWLNVNRYPKGNFGVAIGVKLSSGASLTYSVQHTFDQLVTPTKDWSASRTTTTGTITRTNHGLSIGDWWKGDAPAPFNAEYSVASVIDANNFTITVANSGATSVLAGLYHYWSARIFDHETLVAQTASSDGNYAFPPIAYRLNVTTYASGFVTLDGIQIG